MMFKRAKITKINDAITLIDDANESTFYVVHGTEAALIIDTANGYENVMDIARTITDLPIEVVCTHGHCDHVYGNVYCKEAWLHPNDNALCDEHFAFAETVAFMTEHHLKPCPLKALEIGQVFDLGGGLTLEVVALFGHTPGSIGLLDRKHRILFSGDGVIPQIWMQLPESTSIATLKATLETLLKKHGTEFDYVLTGHGHGLEDGLAMAKGLLHGCDTLLSGDTANDVDYPWFEGVGLAHPYGPGEFQRICYAKDKL